MATVSSAVWGVIGALVGGFLTFLGNLTVSKNERVGRAQELAAEQRASAREERKRAYLRLLTVCRQIRTLARPGRQRGTADIDTLRLELSSATYEIDLIAAGNMSE